MAGNNLVGRKEEQEVLARAQATSEAEFVAVYGRRRVGKTFLVQEFFGRDLCFELVGQSGGRTQDQLQRFTQSLGKAMGQRIPLQQPPSWEEAFAQLELFLEGMPQEKATAKKVVFLDELPWLDTPRSRFIPCLEHFWNRYVSRRSDLVLVTCGSAASWMIQNIVQARGGLHNRVTRRIRLLPFSLAEAKQFLERRGVNLTTRQVAELYMVMGGIPHYLKEAVPGRSAAQIIDQSCFSSQGLLRDEFANLYGSLFDHADQHMEIVRTLMRRRTGLTRGEILNGVSFTTGGTATKRLDELEASGFLRRQIPFGKQEREALYRLADEFSLFHLKWIAALGRRSPGVGYWMQHRNTPAWRAWAGYAFENLCLKHVDRLKAALGISGVQTTESAWQYRPATGSNEEGAQIDLLIDRKDDCVNLCEMKFSEVPFELDRKYAEELRRKARVFREVTGTRKNLLLTLVTAEGLRDSPLARELVASSVTLDELF